MASNPVDDPEFYCHGPQCIADGCSPLRCKDEEERESNAPE